MMDAPRIVFDRMGKRYGAHTAVRELSLTVDGGSVLCLLGPNGAGKTTTLHTLMGLLNPTSGDVRVSGVSVRSPAIHQVRRTMGYVPEQPALYEHLTVRENVQFAAELYGAPWRGRLDAGLERLGIADVADAPVRTCSPGTRKKAALLAATIHEPRILVLDEPTGALDAPGARAVKDLIAGARDRGALVLFSTHVMEIAERVADRVAILRQGELVADGTLQELRSAWGRTPHDTLEELFLRAVAPGGAPSSRSRSFR